MKFRALLTTLTLTITSGSMDACPSNIKLNLTNARAESPDVFHARLPAALKGQEFPEKIRSAFPRTAIALQLDNDPTVASGCQFRNADGVEAHTFVSGQTRGRRRFLKLSLPMHEMGAHWYYWVYIDLATLANVKYPLRQERANTYMVHNLGPIKAHEKIGTYEVSLLAD